MPNCRFYLLKRSGLRPGFLNWKRASWCVWEVHMGTQTGHWHIVGKQDNNKYIVVLFFVFDLGRATISSLFLRFVLMLQYYVSENVTVLISKKCPYLWLISFSRATNIARSFRLIVQLHRLNPHWEMDKTFSPSCSPSQITYVEAEAVGFSHFRFRFHRKRTASTASASTSVIAMPLCWLSVTNINQSVLCSPIQQSVKYEDSQHFVCSNLWTVGRLLLFTKSQL